MGIQFEIHDKPCLNRIHVCCVILLLLCCWGCGDPPNSVMEMVLPDKDMPAEEPAVTMADVKTTPAEEGTAAAEQPPAETEAAAEAEPPPPPVEPELPEMPEPPDLSLAMEMDAIMASEGEVLSPIPDRVYEQLWGNWTEAGSLAPRKFYKKFIDADGIAIVGSENVDNAFFQMARHIVLVMTSKVPSVREALSIDQPGGVSGEDVPFRLVLTNSEAQDVVNMPENLNGNLGDSKFWVGSFRGYLARVNVAILGDDGNFWGHQIIIHEMVHAIEYAIAVRNLVPNFVQRQNTAFATEMEKVRIRTEIDGVTYPGTTKDLPEWDRPDYCMPVGNAHDNVSEFFAIYAEHFWFDGMFNPTRRDPNYSQFEVEREECPIVIGVLEEIFPKFSIEFAVETRGYETEDGRILRR